jgi:hypothetical protein
MKLALPAITQPSPDIRAEWLGVSVAGKLTAGPADGHYLLTVDAADLHERLRSLLVAEVATLDADTPPLVRIEVAVKVWPR